MPTDADRVFREFNRYSGDGLPGEPVGAPLPIGDPSSGVAHIRKGDMRGWANGFAVEMGAQIALAEAAADRVDLGALDAAVLATGNDRAQTGLDRVATGLDRAKTGLDVIATAASALSASQDAAAAAQIVADIWSFEDIYASGGLGACVTQFNPASGGLWQEVARTTPVTAAGQRVGSALMSTAAGVAIYAEQATAGNRPYLGRVPSGGRRNLLPNSAGTGAVIGAPGTLPLLWSVTGTAPIREIIGTGFDPAGLPYIDVRVTGAPGAAGVIQLCGNTDMPIAAGAAYAWSAKVAVIAGDATNITYASLQMGWRNAGGGFIGQTTDAADFKADGALSVRAMSATSPALTAFCLPQIRLNCTGAVDITLRISGGQFETGSTRTAAQVVTHTTPLGLDVVEAGVQSLWSLHRSDVAQALSVTLADMGTSATVMRATVAASTITDGLTIGAGAYSILGAPGTGTVSFAVVNRGMTDAEKRLSTGSMDRARGVPLASVPVVLSGAVSLADLGYTPSSGDVRDMIAAAALLSDSNEVIIPFHIAPWIQGGQLVVPDGLTVSWEGEARVAQNHAVVDGVVLGTGSRLIRPYFTSTVWTRENMVGLDLPTAMAGYGHNKRAIRVNGNNVEILDVQMLEYMAGGIKQVSGTGLRVTNLTARHLRSAEGYAAAIDLMGGVDGAYVEVNTITDCDRAMEPEDGCSNVTFVAKPGVLTRIWSRYYDIAANGIAQGFCLSDHTHDYGTPCRNIHYKGSWTCIDCVTPVFCDRATAAVDQMPQGMVVDHVTIRNTAAFPTAFADIGNRPQVWIECHAADVTVVFEHPDGAPIAQARVQIREGRGNTVTLPGPDIQAALPWITVSAEAVASRLNVTATNQSAQPSIPADPAQNHLIEDYGAGTSITAKIHGVQHRGYVQFRSVARGGRVHDFDFRMPATNAPNAAVRFAACESCAVTDGVFVSTAGLGQLARMTNNSTRNRLTSNTAITAGTFATMDTGSPGAVGNLVALNSIGAATIYGAAGNTVVNNV